MIKRILKPIIFLTVVLIITVILTVASNKNSEKENGENGQISASVDKNDDRFCVLIFGKDKVSGLSDVIMLASFDAENKNACVLQIPRDTYAEYENSEYRKINGVLRALGEEGACSFFEESFGIEIDGFVSIDLKGFRAMVDAMGGVEMNVPRDLKYSDPGQGLYIDLKAGKQLLNGSQSEMLVRYRSGYTRGDLDRLDMQKRFLAAFFVSLKEKITPFNIYSVANSALPYVKTNISVAKMLSLSLNVITLDEENVCIATASGEDAVSEVSGASFYVISAQGVSRVTEKYFTQNGRGFDSEERFLHPSLESFRKIYAKKDENELFLISDLK